MLIVIEGVDGCGKTTVAEEVAKFLRAPLLPFPNDDSVTGGWIRSYLRGGWEVRQDGRHAQNVSALAFQALQTVNRLEYGLELQQAEGAQTIHRVAVRYWQSGWVYGQLDGLSAVWLADIHAALPRADLNILLDVDADISLERVASRGVELERYEGDLAKTQKVVNLYRELWALSSSRQSFTTPKHVWARVSAMQPVELVCRGVLDLVRNRLSALAG